MGGKTIFEKGRTFWTVTLWNDLPAMQSFFGSGAHLRAMPKLRGWCEEACVTHLAWQTSELPTPSEALELLRKQGKFTTLKNPSPLQVAAALPERVTIRFEGGFFP